MPKLRIEESGNQASRVDKEDVIVGEMLIKQGSKEIDILSIDNEGVETNKSASLNQLKERNEEACQNALVELENVQLMMVT